MGLIIAAIFLGMVGYAIKCYGEGKKHVGAFVYFFFVSHGFYLIPDNVIEGLPISKLIDFGTFYLLFVLYKKLTDGIQLRHYLNQHREPKLYFYMFIYLTGLFIWTVGTGKEAFGMSLAVYRNMFRFFSFMIFIDLNLKQLKWVFKRVFYITTAACVLYVVQPIIGIKTLTGGSIGEVNSIGILRYRNIPYLAYFFLIYATLTLDLSRPKRMALLLLFVVSLVLTQHRGIMVGYAVSIIAYLLLERKFTKMIQYSIIGTLLFVMAGNYVMARFKQGDSGSDFKALMNLDYRKVSFENDNEGGTLTFRFMHLLERVDYLLHNTKYIMQGVGLLHEDSPSTSKNYSFYICSRKMTDKGWTNEQLDTGDLVWSTPLIKTGLIGFGFYVVITLCLFHFFFVNRKVSGIANITLYYYVLLIVTSFKNDQLFDAIHLFMIFLVYHIIKKQKMLIQ